jgi:16S rRNA (guanine(966)-N(2))-methyltransferase RsmD
MARPKKPAKQMNTGKKGTLPVCRNGPKGASHKRGLSPFSQNTADVAGLRVIGGRFRGRKLQYSGDLRTRPMKDRVREALFNLLGHAVSGKAAIDLFAGTGALALEALSRGAARAVVVELHRPTARLIAENAASLGIEVRGFQHAPGDVGERTDLAPRNERHVAVKDQYIEIVTANTFLWAKQLPDLGTMPWVVFCSPPYEFYVERNSDMLELLNHLIQAAPAESLFAVEADERFDFGLLPHHEEWDIRQYPPAVLGIWEKSGNGATGICRGVALP